MAKNPDPSMEFMCNDALWRAVLTDAVKVLEKEALFPQGAKGFVRARLSEMYSGMRVMAIHTLQTCEPGTFFESFAKDMADAGYSEPDLGQQEED